MHLSSGEHGRPAAGRAIAFRLPARVDARRPTRSDLPRPDGSGVVSLRAPALRPLWWRASLDSGAPRLARRPGCSCCRWPSQADATSPRPRGPLVNTSSGADPVCRVRRGSYPSTRSRKVGRNRCGGHPRRCSA